MFIVKIRESAMADNGGGFRARADHFLYSGEKKHVLAGIGLVCVVFVVPWFFMNRGLSNIIFLWLVGNTHRSHQDYMEKAEKARSQRLSSSASSIK